MSVKKEASGRRSIQVEVEVPGTPEEVWQAIATGPGISSWFVPAEFEEQDGKPVAVKMNIGPGHGVPLRRDGLGSAAEVGRPVRWLGPRHAADRERVERGSARRRHLHRPHCPEPFRQHGRLGQPAGRRRITDGLVSSAPCGSISRISAVNARRSMQLMAPAAGTEAEAWEALTAAVGVKGVSVGQRWTAPAGVPAFSGVVEYLTQSPNDALLRIDKPGPGIAALGTYNWAARAWSRWASTFTAIRRPQPSPARHRSGMRGFKNASRCRRSRARANDRVVLLRRFLHGRASRDHCGLNNGRGIPRIAVSGWRRSASDGSPPATSWRQT